MPLTPEQRQAAAQQYLANRGQTSTPQPTPSFAQPQTIEQQTNALPNANKLTRTERKIYGALPGVTSWMENNRILGGTVSEQLDKFNNSWPGKALQKLDVLAEGLERSVGLIAQMRQPDFDMKDLRSAWYASSLTYDTLNLPQAQYGMVRDPITGKEVERVTGFKVPSDLPGVDGLANHRVEIKRLMELGYSPKDALDKVRDEYYNGLGALALRAQIGDLWGHVLGDPLNLLTGYLKPLQALKARRFLALSTKVTGGAQDFLKGANTAADLLKTAGNATDALKYADEAFQLAQLAGDSKLAAKYATDAADVAKSLGKTEDVTRYADEAGRLANLAPEEAAQFSDEALRAIGKKQLNTTDKIAIMLTGGDPFRPSALGKKLENVPILGKLAKTFQLTPESKAREVMNLLNTNLTTTVVSRIFNDVDAEAQFASYIRRVSKGATGIEYGHAMMTLEGRTVQAFTKGADDAVELIFNTYQKTAKERDMLTALSNTLGETPEKLLRLMDEAPETLMEMLKGKAGMNPAIDALMQTGEISEDGLRSLSKVIGQNPYNREMFFAQAMDSIETNAMRQAVTQFGIKEKGVLTRWADAVKSAESLAFLRVNPGYPIRNKINNDVTLLARGLFGVMDDGAINSFWDDFLGAGLRPERLGEAIGPAQLQPGLSKADEIINDALRGGNMGAPEKVKEFFNGINLGKLDAAKHWGQKFEQAASRKAFTIGTQQGWDLYSKQIKVADHFNPKVLEAIEEVAPGFSKQLTNVIRSSRGSRAKLDQLLQQNLNLNVDSILDDVTAKLGAEVRDSLGDEVLEHLHRGLGDAIQNNKLDDFTLQTRAMINKNIDDLFNKQIENVVEHVSAQAQLGGPNVWAKKMGEAQDIFWGAHIEHSIRMPEATRLAREASSAGEFAMARSLWQKEQADAAQFYGRAFKRVDAYITGLEKGTEALAAKGVKLPFSDIKRTFTKWQDGWKNFFTEKNRLMDEFFDLPKGKRPPFDEVQGKIQKMYDDMAAQEDVLAQTIDDTTAAMIDGPQMKAAYLTARDQLAKLRGEDKRGINQMYEIVSKMPAEQRQTAWNQFWQARVGKYQEMRSVDAASIMIQQGDETALQAFTKAQPAPKEGEFDIAQLANEFGIPSATEAGARNDRRILATVNKYAPQSLDEAASVTMKEATSIPRGELPPEISTRFEQEANRLLDELNSGTGPQVSQPRQGQGGETVRIPSTNIDWYKELPKNLQNKKVLNTALEKIIKDKGSDKGVNVERVKELIIDRFRSGDPNTGTPPDLNMLRQLGADNKTLQGALDDFNDITRQELTLEDAIRQSGGKFDELSDASRPYFDEAGNYVDPSKGTKKYTDIKDVPEDVARKAFEARAKEKGLQVSPKAPQVQPAFIADLSKVVPEPAPLDLGMDMMTYGRTYGALDEVVNSAKTAAQKTPTLLKDLPPEIQTRFMKGLGSLDNELASTRNLAQKFGEWRRDSALLNYNRRTNFDNYLGHVAPFAFWSTSSVAQWALESIDRPAMLTNYLRAKKFMATNGLQRDGQASRTKGKIRVNLPFAPDWMGEQFIDPLRIALPFDNWIAPFEQMQKQQLGIDGRTERFLEQQLADGSISQDEYNDAAESHSGAVWDFAKAKTQENDAGDKYDAWDFGTALASPHAPIMWAYNAAFGDKEDIGPFSPLSRIARNTATTLGVEDWNNSKYNLEAKLRRQMGLSSYDKWDDYRIDRSLSNLAGDGSYSVDEVKEAIAISALVQEGKMTPEQAKEMSEAYREGVKRSNQEYTGGAGAFISGLLGISVTSVPQGENNLRALQDDFGRAYATYDKAAKSLDAYLDAHPDMDAEAAEDAWEKANPKLAKDADALGNFFDENPEYETRLGLFDKPEERLHKFMVDELWSAYNTMPKVNQDEVREHLGTDFQASFLNKETRNTDDVPTELLSVWMKMMHVDPLGGLTADQRMLVGLYGKVQLTDPETANRVQMFYDNRKQNFSDFYELQSAYYELPKGTKRKAFMRTHPELSQYFDYRTGFMRDNPDLVPYLTDDERAIERARNQARTTAAVPTAQELQQITSYLPPDIKDLVYDFAQSGDELPPVLVEELEFIASQQGMDPQQFVNILGAGVYGTR
jgi:hypothetical protein